MKNEHSRSLEPIPDFAAFAYYNIKKHSYAMLKHNTNRRNAHELQNLRSAARCSV